MIVQVREGPTSESRELGLMEPGDVIRVLETRVDESAHIRVKFKVSFAGSFSGHGWASLVSKSGAKVFFTEGGVAPEGGDGPVLVPLSTRLYGEKGY